jgi:alkylation response protein AidB-like acyl-CoA dehydrogenase
MSGACLSLQLNPMLTQGAIAALERHADRTLKERYLPRLVSGEWSATMNLTEPQAGSDVSALTTRAEANGDGSHAITGQKIFITWGDAEFLPNICHMVLARLPGAAPGTRGISLFLVPKYLPDAQGAPGRPNALRVVSLEHKLGLHGSPTCVMSYEGATGWLVGAEGGGMAAMFTMMNNARLGVGVQGIGQAEAALQLALAHARQRRQGPTGRPGAGTIVDHADVRRMLAQMTALIRAARGIALLNAVAIDMARATGDALWQARAALLTPITKAFGTDTGIRVAELGLQVHGGMGYIEETGAAQICRDVRVTAIFVATNGIPALDLVGRKGADGGAEAMRLLDEVQAAARAAGDRLPDLAAAVDTAAEDLRDTTRTLLARPAEARAAGATAYLAAFALVLGGHVHLTAAAAGPATGPHARLAAFYVARILPGLGGLLAEATADPEVVFAVTAEDLGD